jgi:hypothetical protein
MIDAMVLIGLITPVNLLYQFLIGFIAEENQEEE